MSGDAIGRVAGKRRDRPPIASTRSRAPSSRTGTCSAVDRRRPSRPATGPNGWRRCGTSIRRSSGRPSSSGRRCTGASRGRACGTTTCEWASDYRLAIEKLESLGGDRVFAVLSLTGRDKTTGREITSRFYDIFTIRDGMIARLEEYTSRAEAFGENVDRLRAFWDAWTPGRRDRHVDSGCRRGSTRTRPSPITWARSTGATRAIARAAERWLEPYESMTIELERISGSRRPAGVGPSCPDEGEVHRHRGGGAGGLCLDLPRRQGDPLPFVPGPRTRPSRTPG